MVLSPSIVSHIFPNIPCKNVSHNNTNILCNSVSHIISNIPCNSTAKISKLRTSGIKPVVQESWRQLWYSHCACAILWFMRTTSSLSHFQCDSNTQLSHIQDILNALQIASLRMKYQLRKLGTQSAISSITMQEGQTMFHLNILSSAIHLYELVL